MLRAKGAVCLRLSFIEKPKPATFGAQDFYHEPKLPDMRAPPGSLSTGNENSECALCHLRCEMKLDNLRADIFVYWSSNTRRKDLGTFGLVAN